MDFSDNNTLRALSYFRGIEVRQARVADLTRMSSIAVANNLLAKDDVFADGTQTHALVAVNRRDSTVIGYLKAIRSSEFDDFGWVIQNVACSAHGGGVGSMLLAYAMQAFNNSDAGCKVSLVVIRNSRARNLYRRIGFLTPDAYPDNFPEEESMVSVAERGLYYFMQSSSALKSLAITRSKIKLRGTGVLLANAARQRRRKLEVRMAGTARSEFHFSASVLNLDATDSNRSETVTLHNFLTATSSGHNQFEINCKMIV